MPWSKNRIYDKTFDDSLAEIRSHVQKLKKEGATKIIVAGHSLGAVTTAGYGARVGDVDGLILLAPGHFTNQRGFSQYFGDDLAIAKQLVDSGKGDDKATFGDVNSGVRATRYITANIFLSWFSPSGPAEFVDNMTQIGQKIPILYVAGSMDKIPETQNREYAFDKVVRHSKSRFLIIESSHLDVPERASEVVIEWIRAL
jgi:esterase/lipase